jgi:predicted acyltransferase
MDILSQSTQASPTETSDSPMQRSQRILSIDALRGFDLFVIVGGSRIILEFIKASKVGWLQPYVNQFEHVSWEGFTFLDLVMPLFLFIVGVVMPFSFAKRLDRGDSQLRLYLHILIRTVVLFVLGMIAQGQLLAYDLSRLHIYCNTLQAIAVGYFIAAILILRLKPRWQIGVTAVLLVVFFALMKWVPVPGYGAGVLTPEGNLAIYIDKLLLGHFQDETPYTWILSSMTFACTVMLGAFAGYILRSSARQLTKVAYLLGLGVATIGLGLLWSLWFPIIKHLWTSSFVLYAAGMSYILLALFYLVIDVMGFRIWSFGFVVIGANAIFAYMATMLFDFRKIGSIFVGGLSRHLGDWYPFVHALSGFLVLWLILFYLYRKKTFLRV